MASPAPECADCPRSRAAAVLLWIIRGYQHGTANWPSPCRYQPSCSAYALEAVSRFGAIRGSWLSLRRVARCNPWGGHGHDPVSQQ
jgi:uncharacterized protein